MKTAINPWFRKDSPYSHKIFEYPGSKLFEYRGVEVYKNKEGSFDYILGDTAITQRAGFSKESAPSVIDEILDGEKPVSENVYIHLRGIGFSPMSYTEYTTKWLAGEVK